MNFKKSRPLLLMGAALFASASIAASPASAQTSGDCVLGVGANCEDTFGASSAARKVTPSQATTPSTARYDAYVASKEKQQVGLAMALTRAAEQGKQGILKACQAVSPNKPTDACP
ncbi:hypothetical protein [Microvirga aerophila]|uniref:Uncharacterized protein n=1 Tax=Microvirga aerophila TaxID=670291 RepID=A0A512BWK6_9HYPH|nr:hypothetical protein [Microvirga aerophila]GEO16343.1 hypothetical protein MAE02_40390 [Microvirga aerophila]